jgi:hypothetical protein
MPRNICCSRVFSVPWAVRISSRGESDAPASRPSRAASAAGVSFPMAGAWTLPAASTCLSARLRAWWFRPGTDRMNLRYWYARRQFRANWLFRSVMRIVTRHCGRARFNAVKRGDCIATHAAANHFAVRHGPCRGLPA